MELKEKNKKLIIKIAYNAIIIATAFSFFIILFLTLGFPIFIFNKFSFCENFSPRAESCFDLDWLEMLTCVLNYSCPALFIFFHGFISFLILFNIIFPLSYKLEGLVSKLEKKWNISIKEKDLLQVEEKKNTGIALVIYRIFFPKEKYLSKKQLKRISLKERLVLSGKFLIKFFVLCFIVFLLTLIGK